MGIFRTATLVVATMALAWLGATAHADDISRQQEAIRAPLRAAYVQAKRAEQDAVERRRAMLDRMIALLNTGDRELANLQKARTETANALVAKRDERRQAKQVYDIALGRAGGNIHAPEVQSAQQRLDGLDSEIAALEKKIAAYEQLERDRIGLPSGDRIFLELLQANIAVEQARQNTILAIAPYLHALRPQALPPYLQSVQVYVGGRAMYRAEWRFDGEAADLALKELMDRLDVALATAAAVRGEKDQLYEELRNIQRQKISVIKKASDEINLATAEIRFAGLMVVLAPAIIEAIGVIAEVALSGGASTVERHAVEEGIKAGTTLAGALANRNAGKVLSVAEKAVISRFDKALDHTLDEAVEQMLALVQAKVAKGGSDIIMNQSVNGYIDALGLKGGKSDAAKIVASDAAEQVIGRVAKGGVIILNHRLVEGAVKASAGNLTKWQAVRSGASGFFAAKVPVDRLKDGLLGSKSANLLGLGITAAKAIVAAYFGYRLENAEERYINNVALFDLAYHDYYVALLAEQIVQKEARLAEEFYYQLLSYRLLATGPRQLVVLANGGDNDPTETLTFALHFSQPLDRPPQARIAGLVLDMKPQGAADRGRWAHWEAQLPARKLPDGADEGVLEVSLADGSTPYAALDGNPVTPTRFVIPDALDQPLPDREEWSDYERGPDRNHRIAFRPPRLPQTVPWRGASSCDRINCDCGVIPIAPGVAGDADRKICQASEDALRRDCLARKQTFATCPPNAGPAAYPPAAR